MQLIRVSLKDQNLHTCPHEGAHAVKQELTFGPRFAFASAAVSVCSILPTLYPAASSRWHASSIPDCGQPT